MTWRETRARIEDFSSHPWLTIRVQIALGVVFILAALPKIADPPSFAHMIYNYQLVPGWLINIFALSLPWAELLLGTALVLGLWRRTSLFLIGALLVVFIVAIGINLFAGNPIDCGCFDVSSAGKSDAELLGDMIWTIIRDFLLLAGVVQVYLGLRRERLAPYPVTGEPPMLREAAS